MSGKECVKGNVEGNVRKGMRRRCCGEGDEAREV